MDLSWLESILFGFFSGLADILPVSAQAHQIILLKLFGKSTVPAELQLLIHLATLAAIYYNCQSYILRIIRARNLAKIPRRRRRRPLDIRSLMDFSLWKTTLIPIIVAFFFYSKAQTLSGNLVWLAGFLFLNGVILYVPQFLPSGNRDSRTLSRVEGLLIGLGGAASVLPGISCVGASVSVAGACGVDRPFGLNMALLMNLAVTVGFCVFDVLSIVSVGFSALSLSILLYYILAAAAAFVGVTLAIRIMRALAVNIGFTGFSYYCWGGALFAFILYLAA